MARPCLEDGEVVDEFQEVIVFGSWKRAHKIDLVPAVAGDGAMDRKMLPMRRCSKHTEVLHPISVRNPHSLYSA